MNKKFSCIIVDDEKLAREELKELFKQITGIELIGEASNAAEAKNLIDKYNPDLIFLDIQMPGKSGFDLLNEINTDAEIIFVSAYDEYALKAFEVNALDYLLKPVTKERLSAAVQNLAELYTEPESSLEKFNNNEYLFLMVNNDYHFVKINSIIKITAAGNYTEIFTANKLKGLVQKSLREWELRLPGELFVRIHRNTMVNLDYVERIDSRINYAFQVYLKECHDAAIMSRRYAIKLKNLMS